VYYFSPYSASKFAIRGFSESLREELEALDKSDIRVCTVIPATIDTPLFQHAANYTGREVKALPPVYDVETAAKTFVDLVEHPQREVFVGTAGSMITGMHTMTPALPSRPLPSRSTRATSPKTSPLPQALATCLSPCRKALTRQAAGKIRSRSGHIAAGRI
jgi:short-subunit dehydrogenase